MTNYLVLRLYKPNIYAIDGIKSMAIDRLKEWSC